MFTLIPLHYATDAAVIVADFEVMLLSGKMEEACAKHMTQDFILVEAPGLPYTYSIYEGVLAMLAFFREVQPLLSWGKPTVQVFGLTPERCIMKVYDAECELHETGEIFPFDVLEESWMKDEKFYKIKSYYFDQLPLIKSQISDKGPSEFLALKEDEGELKSAQLKKYRLHDAP